jgi:regulator of sigma E protease
MSTIIFAVILVLGAVIIIHELGHFLFARLCGVGVETFSVGYGPRLIGKKIGLTDYRISAIPLGGYVKMVGEEPGVEIAQEDIPISYTHQHVLKRIMIAAAGPAFNFLLAVIIFFVLFLIYGYFILKPTVGSVKADSPAEIGGIREGDLILAIGGAPISRWDELATIIAESDGGDLAISIRREDTTLVIKVVPERVASKNIFGEDIERNMIGITSAGDTYLKDLNILEAFSESLKQTYMITRLMLLSIVKLIQGTLSIKTLGGPIMIAEMAGEHAKEGINSLVFFIALISINLAIINLLPIPVLDGGHLLFFFAELVIGHPVSLKIREIAQQAGMFILLLLMVYVFYNDIDRVFFN